MGHQNERYVVQLLRDSSNPWLLYCDLKPAFTHSSASSPAPRSHHPNISTCWHPFIAVLTFYMTKLHLTILICHASLYPQQVLLSQVVCIVLSGGLKDGEVSKTPVAVYRRPFGCGSRCFHSHFQIHYTYYFEVNSHDASHSKYILASPDPDLNLSCWLSTSPCYLLGQTIHSGPMI